jgi:hypothetical protein
VLSGYGTHLVYVHPRLESPPPTDEQVAERVREDLINEEREKLQPLSAYLGKPAPEAAPAIQWKRWKEGVETTEEFWPYVNFLVPLTNPNPQDKPVLDRMAKLGLVAGKPWDASGWFPASTGRASPSGMVLGKCLLSRGSSEP